MWYIEERNKFIKTVNDPKLKKPEDYFTPDDIGEFVALAVKKYVENPKNMSLLDPMWWSWNLVYQVVKKLWKWKLTKVIVNRYNQKADDKDVYKELRKELKNNVWSVSFSEKNVESLNTKGDIVVVNLDGGFLWNHEKIQKLTKQYCFILDTKPKGKVSSKSNFELKAVINLWPVWIGWRSYYLYVYKRNKRF